MAEGYANPAVVGRRIFAALIDVLLWVIILLLAALRFGIRTTEPNGANISLTGAPFLVYLLALLAYYVLLEWGWSQTLGKKLLGLRAVNYSGSGISFAKSLVRNVLRLVDGLPYFIPYLLGGLIFTMHPEKRRIGDVLAHAYVTR